MNIRIPLIAKFTCASFLILLVFMGLLDSFNLRKFRKVMTEYAAANAKSIAEAVNQSAYDAMMANDKSSLNHMISRVARGENIEHVRLIDAKGRIIFSSVNGEEGSPIGTFADECTLCHNSDQGGPAGPAANRSRIITTRSGKESLGFTKAIYNQPACFSAACHFHKSDDVILGFLDISVSLDVLHQKSREYRLEFIVLTCMLLLLIGIMITMLTYYLVDIPVQRLVRHSALVAMGNLSSRVNVSGRDELGELSEAFNSMTESLGEADRKLKEWAESLERKVEERSREIVRMEEQLRRSEKLASLGTLAAGVAHEINNPLTGILLYASIISSDKRLDPALQADIGKVISETTRCAGIVKNLLEFSRESEPVKEEADLNTLVDAVVTLFRKQPDFREITITSHYKEGLPKVLIDPNQIRQVFMNLVINAGQAMAGQGSLEATTFKSADGAFVCVSFKDSGEGIPDENLARIFDPFFTTKADGTGLGLAISYGIVEANGGHIDVMSRRGEGSTFLVKLPVNRTGQQDS